MQHTYTQVYTHIHACMHACMQSAGILSLLAASMHILSWPCVCPHVCIFLSYC